MFKNFYMCPGRFLGMKIGQNPSVCKANQLHVVIIKSFLY